MAHTPKSAIQCKFAKLRIVVVVVITKQELWANPSRMKLKLYQCFNMKMMPNFLIVVQCTHERAITY